MLTNEERQLEIYATSAKPTKPAEVSPNTPLEALNLNWRERDLPGDDLLVFSINIKITD